MNVTTSDWDVHHPAVHHECLIGPTGARETALLRHPGYPMCATVASDRLFDELVELADAYRARVGALPTPLAAPPACQWRPVTWPEGDPLGSFEVCAGNGRAADSRCSIVLLGNSPGEGGGLRVVMHLDPPDGGVRRVRVTGLSAARYAPADPSDPAPAPGAPPAQRGAQPVKNNPDLPAAIVPALPPAAMAPANGNPVPGFDRAQLPYRYAQPTLPAVLADRNGRFEVMQSALASSRNDPDQPQRVDPGRLARRSDHLSAAHAYWRAQEFFAVLDHLEMPAGRYFKFAAPRLRMRHRAGFDSRPDGMTVNAKVQAVGAPVRLDRYRGGERPTLEVLFGAASVREREVHDDDHGLRSPQPLGLAADRRWAWHEFGHVLSYAATGALEFQFAHSAGDALAAVLCDPESDARSAQDPQQRYRTFPLVGADRRHDRDPLLGWCWCGRRNGMRQAPLVFPPQLYKGYLEEQMLSSSIFRLYRSIGGDTFEELETRQRASKVCAYLILRAITLLGPAEIVPARSADAFVSALVDADIGTGRYPGIADGAPAGGTFHKVIRWAFEQQGLFATADPTRYVDEVGEPPAVDLWIRDARDDEGGYEPISLGGDLRASPLLAEPASIRVASDSVAVLVGNRGRRAASTVRVDLWAAPLHEGTLQWRHLGSGSCPALPAATADWIDIPVESAPAPSDYILAAASCEEDPSNIDARSGLPCAQEPPHSEVLLRDLVANDNNLALALAGA